MIDLANDEKRARFRKAITQSRTAMEPFRKVNKELITDYMGSWYPGSKRPKTMVNLINQTARIYSVALAQNNPQVLISTPIYDNLPFARIFERNLNKLIGDMALDQTYRLVVLDAFFMLGCVNVMMRDTDTRFLGMNEAEEDVWIDPGEPFINRIGFDDLILDMPVRQLSKMRYCGHRYRADFEKVMDEPGFDKKVKDQLHATKRSHHDSVGAVRDVASEYGTAEDDDLKDMIWLQDIWIAENKSIVTMTVDGDFEPLIEREWKGSQAGPYKFLSLGDTPDNIIPTSPAMNLKGMHDLMNRLHRRMERDSDAHRVINVYPASAATDAEKLRTADRNSWHGCNNPRDIQQVEFGGVDPRDLGFATALQEVFDRMAGNLQAMGGLGPQASTLGQEELVHGQLSRNVADMRMAVVNFASESLLDLGRLMWEDETLAIQSSMPVGNSGIEVGSNWEPGVRLGAFEDYEFKVEPYSMVFKTPEQKLQELYQTLQELGPLWPMFQASGATMDCEAILDEIARLKNRPEFKRFITFLPPMMAAGGDPHGQTKPAVTSRETVRRNIPTGGTSEARNSATVQSLMGGKSSTNGQMGAAMARKPA